MIQMKLMTLFVVHDSRAAAIHDTHLLGRGFILDGLLAW